MPKRYVLRAVGVYDTEQNVAITSSDTVAWAAYHEWLKTDTPGQEVVLPVQSIALYDPVAAGAARVERIAEAETARKERKLKIQAKSDPIVAAFLKLTGGK